MLSSDVVFLHPSAHQHTAAHTWALLEHFNWESFEHPPYSHALTPSDYDLFTHIYLKNWLSSLHLTVIRIWWKVSKHGWTHRRQTSLTQAYKNLFRDVTNVSVLALTMLRSSSSIYVFFVYNTSCLIASVGIHMECPFMVSHAELGNSLNTAGHNEAGWTNVAPAARLM
jgi:hypothetical protein